MVDSTILSWPKSLPVIVLSLISYTNLDHCLNFLIQKMEIITVPVWRGSCKNQMRQHSTKSLGTVYEYTSAKLLSRVWLFVTPWTLDCQVSLSMGFFRQEYWSGHHFLLQGIFPTQESNPGLLHCRQILDCLSHQGNWHTISSQ